MDNDWNWIWSMKKPHKIIFFCGLLSIERFLRTRIVLIETYPKTRFVATVATLKRLTIYLENVTLLKTLGNLSQVTFLGATEEMSLLLG